jgi:protoporphyrinogen oxidase
MKVLVLGGGAQGSAAAYDLLQDDGVTEVVIGDMQTEGGAFLRPYLAGGGAGSFGGAGGRPRPGRCGGPWRA